METCSTDALSSASNSPHEPTRNKAADDSKSAMNRAQQQHYVVAESFRDPTHCGHALSLEEVVALIHHTPISSSSSSKATNTSRVTTCPYCQCPVGYIEERSSYDVVVEESSPPMTRSTVYFKYGKMVFRLLVEPPSTTMRPVVVNSESNGLLSWWWSSAVSLYHGRLQKNSTHTRSGTAQQRIMNVLGMSHNIKILHKGKVLYPVSGDATNSSNGKLSSTDEDAISNRLIELSLAGPQQSSSSPPPPSLLVMGTPDVQQQEWLLNERQQQVSRTENSRTSDDDMWSTVTIVAPKILWQWTCWIVRSTWNVGYSTALRCFHFVQCSIFGKRSTTRQMQTDPNSCSNRQQNPRPHLD